jgi:hypothetical protein
MNNAYPVASQSTVLADGHDRQRVGDCRAARKFLLTRGVARERGRTLKCDASDATCYPPSWELTG